jgi:site-specific recombinase XerD
LSPEVFVKILNKQIPKSENFETQRKRAFLITLYNTPLRESEIYEREDKDFTITESTITIHLLRKKKKSHSESDEPISLNKDSTKLFDELVAYLKGEKWKKKEPLKDEYNRVIRINGRRTLPLNLRPWNVSRQTTLNWVNEFIKNAYCHLFRYIYITGMTKVPGVRMSHLRSKTYLTFAALEKYMYTPEGEEAEFDKLKAEQMKQKEVI